MLRELIAKVRRKPQARAARMVFVHIGKTGGTALAHVLEADAARTGIARYVMLPHSETLSRAAQAYPGAEIGFCLRDPVDRFVSGFYSRQRKGRPRYNSEWSPEEDWAFGRFDSAEALGLALAAGEADALRAIHAVQHLRRGLAHYLEGIEVLERYGARITFIGQQETLAADVDWLRARLDIAPDIGLPQDDVGAHRNPAAVPRALSAPARAALEAHYAQDYQLRDWCLSKRQELGLG